jgi:hypothetical protein
MNSILPARSAISHDAHILQATPHAVAVLTTRIRWLLLIMIAGLAVSGLTAIPLVGEIMLLHGWIGPGTWMQQFWPTMTDWIASLAQAITIVTRDYPSLRYGTDWLAFAHIVLAIAFVGPYRDPVRNIWVVEFGLIACVLVIPVALVFGPIRGIPLFWRLIDCSFGIVGFIPLWLAHRMIVRLDNLTKRS